MWTFLRSLSFQPFSSIVEHGAVDHNITTNNTSSSVVRCTPIMMKFAALAASLFGLSTFAATTTSVPAAVFTYAPGTSTSNDGLGNFGQNNVVSGSYILAVNFDQEKQDIYFHMSAPSGLEWMAWGTGSVMQNSMMFIAYLSENGNNITLSPRVATGNSEPSYYSNVTCALVEGSEYVNGLDSNTATMQVNAVCHNALQWNGGSLDTGTNGKASTSQDFSFAVGPAPWGAGLQSNSLSAGLKRHSAYGAFTMDMSKAVSASSSGAGVPTASNNEWNMTATTLNMSKQDFDPAPAIHGLIMCVCFVILFPVGALVLRAMSAVKSHAWVQGVAGVLVLMAAAGGVVNSLQYNRSRNFNSAHQIIGILLVLGVAVQFGLGFQHHRLYKAFSKPTILGKVHLYLGPAVLLLGIINAPLGFVLALNPRLCLPYTVLVLIMVIIYVSIRFGSRICCRGRRKRQQDPAAYEGYQQPQFAPPPGAPPGHQSTSPYLNPPPPYGRNESYSSDDVPLRPYESTGSGFGADQPQQPRPMV